MSKSKKNTVDPETMIKQYGADAVRWFILSDSPPEKDVQWSDTGVFSSNKFLQKIWNLNQLILNNKERNSIKEDEENFKIKIETYVYKIDKAIKRIADNTYGFCEETGEPIGLKRLIARPIATLSIEAQEKHEKDEKIFADI